MQSLRLRLSINLSKNLAGNWIACGASPKSGDDTRSNAQTGNDTEAAINLQEGYKGIVTTSLTVSVHGSFIVFRLLIIFVVLLCCCYSSRSYSLGIFCSGFRWWEAWGRRDCRGSNDHTTACRCSLFLLPLILLTICSSVLLLQSINLSRHFWLRLSRKSSLKMKGLSLLPQPVGGPSFLFLFLLLTISSSLLLLCCLFLCWFSNSCKRSNTSYGGSFLPDHGPNDRQRMQVILWPPNYCVQPGQLSRRVTQNPKCPDQVGRVRRSEPESAILLWPSLALASTFFLRALVSWVMRLFSPTLLLTISMFLF